MIRPEKISLLSVHIGQLMPICPTSGTETEGYEFEVFFNNKMIFCVKKYVIRGKIG